MGIQRLQAWEEVKGSPAVAATVGDVTASGVDGPVSASTTTGDITLRDVTAVGDIEATAGQLSVDVASVDGKSEITTTSGDINLAIAASLDAAVEVAAETGDISVSQLPLSVTETTTGAAADGTMWAGNGTLTINTNVGDVVLTRLERWALRAAQVEFRWGH